jgi:hypothetical protein
VEEKALTPQSINLIEAALRRGRVGPGGGFGAWFAGRVSGEAAQHGAAGDDVAAPVSLRSRATRDYNEAERAQGGKAGLKGNGQLTICEAAMALG